MKLRARILKAVKNITRALKTPPKPKIKSGCGGCWQGK